MFLNSNGTVSLDISELLQLTEILDLLLWEYVRKEEESFGGMPSARKDKSMAKCNKLREFLDDMQCSLKEADVVEDTVRYLPSDSHYERLLKRRAYAYHQIRAETLPPHLPMSDFVEWSDKRQKDYDDLDAEISELEKSMKGAK